MIGPKKPGRSAARHHWGPATQGFVQAVGSGAEPEASDFYERLVTLAAPGGSPSKKERSFGILRQRLPTIQHVYYRRIATAQLSRLALAVGEGAQAVTLVADALAEHPTWQYVLPIRELAEALLSERDRPHSVASSVVLERFAHLFRPTADVDVVEEVVAVLRSVDVTSPSALRSIASLSGDKSLVGFLRRVCTESVLERTALFDASVQVAEERLNICAWLLTLDPDSSAAYQNEISEVTRRLVVARRLKEVERSKVYVDVERLRKDLLERLTDSFGRYRALRSGKALPQPTMLSVKSDSTDRPTLVITIGRDDVSTLFESMVVQIRDAYVDNPDYGLNKYLSLRIRHGTFTAHLRSPIEEAKLITAMDLGGLGYRPNEYWPASAYPYSVDSRAILTRKLSEFSEAYDSLLNETKALLTISKDPAGSGLFDFELRAGSVRAMETLFAREDITLSPFIERVLTYCDELLDQSLADVRKLIEHDFKVRASTLLDNLAVDVASMGPSTNGLVNAIGQAGVSLRVSADGVRDWFARSAGEISEPFQLDEALEVVLQNARRMSPQFRLEADITPVKDIRFQGSLMFNLIDVLLIVFGNVIMHSGLNPPRAELRAWRDERGTCIVCDNELASSVDIDKIQKRFEAVRLAAPSQEGVQAISKEGGTGLYKLARIVTNDLAAVGTYQFRITDRVVSIEFSLPDRVMVSS